MISILGRAAILMALAGCSVGAVTGIYAGTQKSGEALRWSRWMAYVVGVATTFATLLMEYALLTHDFSVAYVAEVGSTLTPVWVTIVSLWSSLNGSILLWAFVLGAALAFFAWQIRDRFSDHAPWAMGIAHLIGLFFTFLVASVANPFEAVPPIADGPGPNPLLQNHILMVIHPPMLYLGYVGMTIPYAMGCAALMAGKLDAAWTRLLRHWMLVPWAFLTGGIVLGGWWSYEVLGWGGWWAWDPVENASFLPWLTATAFIHSAMVMERRDKLTGWSLSLVLATFLLTILGTFMTRSGVFNSVHSFTQSAIGPVFLTFLAVGLIFSVILLSARIDRLDLAGDAVEEPVSRETAILFNNLLFTAFTFLVLVGTVFPLLNEAITGKQLSVGEPYFNTFAGPIGILIVFLMGVGPALPWGRARAANPWKRLSIPFALALVAVGLGYALGMHKLWPLMTLGVSGFATATTLMEMAAPVRARMAATSEGPVLAAVTVMQRSHRRYGGYIVHLGVIAIAIAHATAMAYSTKDSLTFTEGQTRSVHGYDITFTGARWEEEPHRTSLVAAFVLRQGGRDLGTLEPRLNHYAKMGSPIGTPVVNSGVDEDLYLNLVNVDEKAGMASLEVLVRPLVVWLWLGGLLMVVGTGVSLVPASRGKRASPALPGSEASSAAEAASK